MYVSTLKMDGKNLYVADTTYANPNANCSIRNQGIILSFSFYLGLKPSIRSKTSV